LNPLFGSSLEPLCVNLPPNFPLTEPKMALNIARQEPSKGSVRGKITQAAWSDEFTIDINKDAVKV